FPRAQSEQFETVDEASNALIEGRVDAFLEEEPVPSFLALENPSTVSAPLSGPLVQRRAGFAIAKGDPDFLAYLNAWITSREADTWLPTIHSYWFSSLRWREP
ncbi:MAG TPA: transporter substrate-binding domain-containing protein, partial [Gammaproteobacteria bacterium]